MAYLAIKRVKGFRYYYVMRSERTAKGPRAKLLEYLGRDPDPKRLRKALTYWGVKRKGGK